VRLSPAVRTGTSGNLSRIRSPINSDTISIFAPSMNISSVGRLRTFPIFLWDGTLFPDDSQPIGRKSVRTREKTESGVFFPILAATRLKKAAHDDS
jgi:hypothetical protein